LSDYAALRAVALPVSRLLQVFKLIFLLND